MKFAQIEHGVVHWIFEAEERPEFAPNIVLVDITGNTEVQEGWTYDATTGIFTEPIAPEPDLPAAPTLEEMQMQTLLNTEYLVVMSELSNL